MQGFQIWLVLIYSGSKQTLRWCLNFLPHLLDRDKKNIIPKLTDIRTELTMGTMIMRVMLTAVSLCGDAWPLFPFVQPRYNTAQSRAEPRKINRESIRTICGRSGLYRTAILKYCRRSHPLDSLFLPAVPVPSERIYGKPHQYNLIYGNINIATWDRSFQIH